MGVGTERRLSPSARMPPHRTCGSSVVFPPRNAALSPVETFEHESIHFQTSFPETAQTAGLETSLSHRASAWERSHSGREAGGSDSHR